MLATADRIRRAMAVVVALVLLLWLPACGGAPRDGDAPLTATTPRSMPAGDATIEPGTYRIVRSPWSVVEFDVTFPKGWSVQYGHVYAKHQDQDSELGFYAVVVDEIYDDPCHGEGVPLQVGSGADGLAAALLQQPNVEATGPMRATLGDKEAVRVDLRVPPDLDLARCRFAASGVHGLQIWNSPPVEKHFVLLADATATVYILDVGDERQVFLAQRRLAASQADVAELQAVLDSIRIAGA